MKIVSVKVIDRHIGLGDRFVYNDDEYILALVDVNEKGYFLMALINLIDGNRWYKPVVIKDKNNISNKEFISLIQPNEICGFDKWFYLKNGIKYAISKF
jgi:hypothetical protein